MIEWLFLVIGLIAGVIITYFVVRKLVITEFTAQFQQWKLDTERQIRRQALDQSRATLKGQISEQLAPILPQFNYQPSDARFIGNPIDYVIFENYTDVKDRRSKKPISITFMDIKAGKSSRLTSVENKIKQAVEEQRVKWETLHIEEQQFQQ